MAKMTLPLLITKQFCVFPEQRNLQVDAGRDFSIKAINASRDLNSSLLLVVTQKDASIEVPTSKDVNEIGTLCRITSYTNMKTYIRVHITGTKRVKINNFSFDQAGYFVADAETIEDPEKDSVKVIALCKAIIENVIAMPKVNGVIPALTFKEITSRGVEPNKLADVLAPFVPLTDEGRMAILNELDVEKRLELVLLALEEVKKEAEVEREIQKDVSESTEKQQRDYILREKLRAIKKELGDDPEGATDEENIKKRLEENPYPERIKKIAVKRCVSKTPKAKLKLFSKYLIFFSGMKNTACFLPFSAPCPAA